MFNKGMTQYTCPNAYIPTHGTEELCAFDLARLQFRRSSGMGQEQKVGMQVGM